jgi:hypothetical protein
VGDTSLYDNIWINREYTSKSEWKGEAGAVAFDKDLYEDSPKVLLKKMIRTMRKEEQQFYITPGTTACHNRGVGPPTSVGSVPH